jgi:hypothetical protein
VRTGGSALHLYELSGARAQSILREGEFVARTAQGEGELVQLQFGGVRCRVGVCAESYELCARRGVLMFEGLGALDCHGGFQGMPL